MLTFDRDALLASFVHALAEPLLDALHLPLVRRLRRAQLFERVERDACSRSLVEAVRLCKDVSDCLPATQVAEVAHIRVRKQWRRVRGVCDVLDALHVRGEWLRYR